MTEGIIPEAADPDKESNGVPASSFDQVADAVSCKRHPTKVGGPMLCKGYALIEATVGKAREVAQALKDLAGVSEAYLITGPIDMVAIVEGSDPIEVSNVVATRIHSGPGVARTITCLAIPISCATPQPALVAALP